MGDCKTCGQSTFTTAKNIVKGVVNAIFETEEIKALAEPRLVVCRGCINSKQVAKMGGVGALQCSICKCFCALKAKVEDEHCPINLW